MGRKANDRTGKFDCYCMMLGMNTDYQYSQEAEGVRCGDQDLDLFSLAMIILKKKLLV